MGTPWQCRCTRTPKGMQTAASDGGCVPLPLLAKHSGFPVSCSHFPDEETG